MLEVPLYCERCGVSIEKKRGAKTPKYCVGCRRLIQNAYKNKVLNQHRINTKQAQERFKSIKSSNIEEDVLL